MPHEGQPAAERQSDSWGWLQGAAREAFAEAVGQHRDFTLPERNDLRRCERCGDHAAIGTCEGEYVCGSPCSARASIFSVAMPPDDSRVIAMDLALRQKEDEDDAGND